MIGKVSPLIDLVGQDPLAIKYIEEIFQNELAPEEAYKRIIRASNKKITWKELNDLRDLRNKYEADRTDTNVSLKHCQVPEWRYKNTFEKILAYYPKIKINTDKDFLKTYK